MKGIMTFYHNSQETIEQWNFFFVRHHLTNGRFVLTIQPGNLRVRFFFSISIIPRILTFSLTERISRLLLGLETLPASLLLRFEAIIMVNKGFLNKNTAITRQLIRTARTLEADGGKFAGKRGYGDKGTWVKYWARLGCCISPR